MKSLHLLGLDSHVRDTETHQGNFGPYNGNPIKPNVGFIITNTNNKALLTATLKDRQGVEFNVAVRQSSMVYLPISITEIVTLGPQGRIVLCV